MMQKETQLLQKRFIELSKIAYQREIITFSDFLNLNELNILHTIPKNSLYTNFQVFGGYDIAERQIVAFLPDALYCELLYPMEGILIEPLQKKFAEKLTHRDYLGAILNTGIERCKIGDILLLDNSAFVFFHQSLSDFIIQYLTRVKNTPVQLKHKNYNDIVYTPSYHEIKGAVASIRLDSLLSLAFPLSRSKLVGYIESGKVFVNGKVTISNSYLVKDDDIISVRKLGKFQYKGINTTTKKGRYNVTIYKYI